jgi:hypothetical protein
VCRKSKAALSPDRIGQNRQKPQGERKTPRKETNRKEKIVKETMDCRVVECGTREVLLKEERFNDVV